jgi:hypothetical protein
VEAEEQTLCRAERAVLPLLLAQVAMAQVGQQAVHRRDLPQVAVVAGAILLMLLTQAERVVTVA